MTNVIPPESSINCPHCKQNDAVQKASAIYNSGITSFYTQEPTSVAVNGQMAYGMVNQSHTTITGLAKKLQPPNPSVPPPGNPLGQKIMRPALLSYIPGVLVLCFICALMARPMFNPSSGAQAASPTLFFVGIPIIALVALPITVGLPLIVSNRARKRIVAEFGQKALNRWNRLYYCQRCDGVFLPNETRYIPSDQVSAYLYE